MVTKSDTIDPAIAAQNELVRKQVVKDHWTASEVIRNMQANIQRRLTEGKTEEPSLYPDHPDNKGKTQYQIERETLATYITTITIIEVGNPEVFRATLTDVTTTLGGGEGNGAYLSGNEASR